MAKKLTGTVSQLPLFAPQSSWRPPRVADLPSWADAKRISIDTEFWDPQLVDLGIGVRRPGTFVCGFTVAIEDGPSWYLPVQHPSDNVENPAQAWAWLRDNAKHYKGDVVGTSMECDLDYLAENNVLFPCARYFRDVQIADAIIYELHYKYSLDAIAGRFDLPGKNTDLLMKAARAFRVHHKAGIASLPARFVGPYGEQDGHLPLQALRRQERLIEEQNLWEVYNLESKLLPVLVKMRRRGVRIHQDRLAQVEEFSVREEGRCLDEVHRLSGVRIALGDVWKGAVLAQALEAVGVKVPRTEDGTPSVDKAIMKGSKTEVGTLLNRARAVNKMRTTFAESIRKYMVRGRIHSTFNQMKTTDADDDTSEETSGAAFGRCSSEHPNMQQQISKGDLGKMWRSIFLPEEGAQWVASDYSQQEPRLTCHFAERVNILERKRMGGARKSVLLGGADEAAQRYRDNPKVDNHEMMMRIIYGDTHVNALGLPSDEFPDGLPAYKSTRDQCKIIFLGVSYGMGGAKLCRSLGLPTRWAVFPEKWGEEARYFAPEAKSEAAEFFRKSGGRQFMEVAGEAGQAVLNQFNAGLPYVSGLAKMCMNKAKREGFIKTLSGRRCRFPVGEDGKYWDTFAALNRLIQGSAGDQTKKAMVDADAAGYFLQLAVHDELDGSFGSVEEAKGLAECMMAAYPLGLPFRCDVEMGPSWGEAKKVAI